MTRRELLALALAPGRYRDYSRCLPDYLRRLAAEAYQRRNAALARLTTPEAVRERQRWVRETFWNLVGGQPERTPLNARTVGSFERPGYRVEKVVYESVPEFHIPANLYIPAGGRGPFPGVLFQMGHSLNGKAYESYQRCCQGLVKLGYLVLAFDPMGQGERVYYPDASATRTRLASSDEEHTRPGKQMLLVGDTSSRLQVWDAVRSLDYLAAHPLADPKRLASTGQSGGGTLTMLLAAVDDRLAAAVVCAGNTENFACAGFNPPGSTDDAEQNFLGSGPLGFDRWDLLYPLAPQPLLVVVSDKDFFGTYSSQYITSGWEEYGKLRKAYETLGRPEQVEWHATPLPHGLSYDSRMQVYQWFGRWLRGEKEPVNEEPPTQPEPDAALWVAGSGNVVRSFGGQTPFTLNRARAVSRKRGSLPELLGVERRPGWKAISLGRVRSLGGVEVEAVEIQSAPEVWVPAWVFRPRQTSPGRLPLVAVEPGGRNARWREGQLYQQLASAGRTVWVPDLRGVGDLAPEFGGGAAGYARSHNEEEDYAWASLILGRPLVGQRVTDLLAVVAAAGGKASVAALGKMTVPALFAAALQSGITELYLAGGLESFRSVVETEDYSHPFANFVFRLLECTDLPEVAASLAPRRVVMRPEARWGQDLLSF
jgi:dienelactone hydrolase